MNFRALTSADAEEVLQLHYAAVHETARDDYSLEILDKWSPPVDVDRIGIFLKNPDNETRIVVVDEDDKSIIAFGCIIPEKSELRACYVLPSKTKQGVGRKVMQYLEKIAIDEGVDNLELESSITAKVFYEKCGYVVLQKASHPMRLGGTMDCYKMSKRL